MNEISITNTNGQLTVSSLQVATNFEKRHCDVIEAIENIKTENSVVTKMFIESAYKAGTGKSYKCYNITRDGFSLLVMGFTGKKALEWKLKYIEAFNAMEEQLKSKLDYSGLSPQLQYLISLEQKTKALEQKQTELENKLAESKKNRDEIIKATFEFGRIGELQRNEITKAVKKRAIELCRYAETYDKIGKSVISSIYKGLQKEFKVKSYLDLSYNQYTDCMIFVQYYEPDQKLDLKIMHEQPKASMKIFEMLTET